MRVAVCDDDAAQRRQVAELLGALGRAKPELDLQWQEFSSGKALLWSQNPAAFEVYLLDVLMPEPNGIETGLELRRLGAKGEIVYLTATRDYAVESYQAEALAYLVKPVDRQALQGAVERAARRAARRRAGEMLLRTGEGVRRLPFDRLLWVERTGRRMICRCTGGEAVESTSLRASFAETLAPLLQDKRFAACGASYVVNLHHVSAVESGLVKMDDGSALPLPRRAAAGFKRAWMDHWLEESV